MYKLKLFKIFDKDGISVKFSDVNEQISIFDLEKNESLKFTSTLGDTFDFGNVLNILFDTVCIIKTYNYTLIFDYV